MGLLENPQSSSLQLEKELMMFLTCMIFLPTYCVANTLIFVIMEVNGLAKISTFFMLVIRFGIVLVTWKFSLRLNEEAFCLNLRMCMWNKTLKKCIYINY